jgi:molybdate/tungstate transport system substrate-binding protein
MTAVVSGFSRTCALLVACIAITLGAQSPRGQLHVCHAGSLLAAFTQAEEEFKKQHPAVTVVDTSGGSVDLVRRFAAGRLECDVIAPADHLVIDAMLKPAKLADYTIVFAAGRMVLAYKANDPKAALKVSGPFNPPSSIPQVAAGWYDALTAAGVRISGAHPFMDPGGYRAHMIFELAQAHYKVPGLQNALLQHYQVNVADPTSTAAAPSLGKDFNFQFTYEHNAARTATQDASYRYATLPPEIDLSGTPRPIRRGRSVDPTVSVTIPGLGIPGSSASVTIPASATEWGLTIPSNSRNRELAIAFVQTLLGPTGRAALATNGPAPLLPGRVSRADHSRLPAELQALTGN